MCFPDSPINPPKLVVSLVSGAYTLLNELVDLVFNDIVFFPEASTLFRMTDLKWSYKGTLLAIVNASVSDFQISGLGSPYKWP